MIASQMGDTAYRGRIVWMLLTARPDLLPIDLKRQGRAEVHIPLFYPTDEAELRQMFIVLAKKPAPRSPRRTPETVPHKGNLSGADIEGIVGRACRTSLLAGSRTITRERSRRARRLHAVDPDARARGAGARGDHRVHRRRVPAARSEKLDKLGGREKLQERLTAIKQILEER